MSQRWLTLVNTEKSWGSNSQPTSSETHRQETRLSSTSMDHITTIRVITLPMEGMLPGHKKWRLILSVVRKVCYWMVMPLVNQPIPNGNIMLLSPSPYGMMPILPSVSPQQILDYLAINQGVQLLRYGPLRIQHSPSLGTKPMKSQSTTLLTQKLPIFLWQLSNTTEHHGTRIST